jgi:hypothetical protein
MLTGVSWCQPFRPNAEWYLISAFVLLVTLILRRVIDAGMHSIVLSFLFHPTSIKRRPSECTVLHCHSTLCIKLSEWMKFGKSKTAPAPKQHGMAVKFHAFLSCVLDVSECSSSEFGPFIPREDARVPSEKPMPQSRIKSQLSVPYLADHFQRGVCPIQHLNEWHGRSVCGSIQMMGVS